jgi:hypothetical protein
MIGFFEAHVCSVGEVEDINTFLIVLADQADSPRHYLELQRSLEHDEQDAALGMDTYCVVTDTGATHYGGIVSCVLTDDSLVLAFSEEAENALGLKGYRIILALSASDRALLRSGLIKLFDQDKYVPQNLSL